MVIEPLDSWFSEAITCYSPRAWRLTPFKFIFCLPYIFPQAPCVLHPNSHFPLSPFLPIPRLSETPALVLSWSQPLVWLAWYNLHPSIMHEHSSLEKKITSHPCGEAVKKSIKKKNRNSKVFKFQAAFLVGKRRRKRSSDFKPAQTKVTGSGNWSVSFHPTVNQSRCVWGGAEGSPIYPGGGRG